MIRRCTVLQLGPLDIVLQGLMALRAAKQLYPELEITYIARRAGAEAARSVPWIKEAVEFAPEITRESVTRSLEPLRMLPADLLINWTFNDVGSYLGAVIPARIKLGYTRRPDGTLLTTDGWSQFIQAYALERVEQNIHLTDILTTQLLTALQIHDGDPVDAAASAPTSKGFFSLEVSTETLQMLARFPSLKWIAIDLDRINQKNGWSLESTIEFSVYLLDRHPDCGIVLIGGTQHNEAAASIHKNIEQLLGKSAQRVVTHVGDRLFDSTAALVSRCTWLISSSPALIQLASILGTRVLHICSDRFEHTISGPYGNGHYVLARYPESTPSNEIASEAVYSVWSYGSQEWTHRLSVTLEQHIHKQGFWSEFKVLNVFRTRIRGSQDGGGVCYEDVLNQSIHLVDWTAQVMGQISRSWYCGWLPPTGQELGRSRISPALIQRLRAVRESTVVLKKICQEGKRTALELQQRASKLKSDRIMPVKARLEIQNLGKKLVELDLLIDRLAQSQAPLRGFAHMAKVMMHNLKSSALADLGRESAQSYEQLLGGIAIMSEWVDHTLKLVRPSAVQSTGKLRLVQPNPLEGG